MPQKSLLATEYFRAKDNDCGKSVSTLGHDLQKNLVSLN